MGWSSVQAPLTLSKLWSEVDWGREGFIPVAQTGEEQASAGMAADEAGSVYLEVPAGSDDYENSSENFEDHGCSLLLKGIDVNNSNEGEYILEKETTFT